MVERSSDGILVLDREWTVRYLNPSAELILGRRRSELVGERCMFPVSMGETTEIHIERSAWGVASVEVRAAEIRYQGKLLYIVNLHDITRKKRREGRLMELTECLLSFGPYARENIQRLAALCGKLLGGDRVLYVHHDGERLTSWAEWNMPPDFDIHSTGLGRFCYEITVERSGLATVIPNLPEMVDGRESRCMREHGLQTFLGCSVRLDNGQAGSLCVFFAEEVLPGEEEKGLMGTIASAIGVEESRYYSEELRQESIQKVHMAYRQATIYAQELNIKVNELKAREAELKKLSLAIEQSINVIIITDPEGRIEYVNPVFEETTGYSKEEAVGQTPSIISSGETPQSQYEELWRTISAGKTWQGVFKNRKRCGQYYWVNGIVVPIKDDRERITHFLSIQEDITERMRSAEQIRYLASYDGLTGLVNRARFLEVVQRDISHVQSDRYTCAVFIIDIDDFKLINNTLGHKVGDAVLCRVAGFLQDIVGDMDTSYEKGARRDSLVARLGGDEFAVYMTHINEVGVVDAAYNIRMALENLNPPDVLERISVSIGVAMYPRHAANVSELLRKADAALNRAKEPDKSRCHLYVTEDNDLEEVHSRLTWKGRIQKALTEDRFEPWFQPILDLKENRIHHYEALARMRDEDGRILPPGVFIDTAERFGLIGLIDRVMMEKTMKFQAEASRRGMDLTFDLNLSGKDLGDAELLSSIKSKLHETGADPSRLVFEITETSAVHDLSMAIEFVDSLKSIGCHFSLDDFGVGFTSFVYLKELGAGYIKIDGSFIRNLHNNRNDRLLVQAITTVAQGMGIKTIAEYVEKEETVHVLKEIGVDYAQGYLVGMPHPVIKDCWT